MRTVKKIVNLFIIFSPRKQQFTLSNIVSVRTYGGEKQ